MSVSRSYNKQNRKQQNSKQPIQVGIASQAQPNAKFVGEIEFYNVPYKMYKDVKMEFLTEHFPATEGNQKVLFNLEGRAFELSTYQIKIYISNKFVEDSRTAFKDVEYAERHISTLITRKYNRVLDYVLPPIDDELLSDIACSVVKHYNYEIPISTREQYIFSMFNIQGKKFVQVPLMETYLIHRAFIPYVDLSMEKVNVNIEQLIRTYNNLLISYAKSLDTRITMVKEKGEQKPLNLALEDVKYVRALIKFLYDNLSGSSIGKILVLAVLGLRLNSVWSQLIEFAPFLDTEDITFYDIFDDELTTELNNDDFDTLFDKFKEIEVNEEEEELKQLFISVAANLKDYREGRITIMEYDTNYRKIILSYVCSHFASAICEAIEHNEEAKKEAETPAKQANMIFNTMKKSEKGKLINFRDIDVMIFDRLNETEEGETLIIKSIIDQITINSEVGASVFALIDKYYRDNRYFIDSLKDIKCVYNPYEGCVPLANLFKLAVFLENEEIFATFKVLAAHYSSQANKPEYFGLANCAEFVVKDINNNLYTLFNKRQPRFSVEYIKRALNFYSERRINQERRALATQGIAKEAESFKYRCAYQRIQECFLLRKH